MYKLKPSETCRVQMGDKNISLEGFYGLIKHKRLRQETPHLVTVDDQYELSFWK